MNFCKECGTKLNEENSFCSECGTPTTLSSATIPPPNQQGPREAKVKKRSKKQKVVVSIISIIAILSIITYQVGAYLTSKEKVIETFEEAMIAQDTATLSTLITSEDPRLVIDGQTIEGLITFINQTPSYFNELMSDLHTQAAIIDEQTNDEIADGTNSNEDYLFTLKKSGKTAFLFDHYQLYIKPFYPTLHTNYENVTLSINDEDIATSHSDSFQQEFGPLAPGVHNVVAHYQSGDHDFTIEKMINSFDHGEYANVELFFDPTEIEEQTEENLHQQTPEITDHSQEQVLETSIETSTDPTEQMTYQSPSYTFNEIGRFVETYVYVTVESVNNEDFSIAEPLIDPNGDKYQEQKDYTAYLIDRKITQEVLSFEVIDVARIDDRTYEVTAIDEYRIDYGDEGTTSFKTFKSRFIVTILPNGNLALNKLVETTEIN
ncbi:TcaA NTF2-like domain-containing protein [Desertibacillus haloalkaliphilus]|uniref:TcaA NTF2-like domain-containing protein n=1 Tax=Desertibacillus haloalkaliphilus TaxID=1328930 RepID=UPI001C260B98|nr:zinc-ribbon domain-containing protein [Desertibacillus haloalkaliphilus]MBU8906520.1 zinc-ribbon domain-containing protein [Desertibacillus haloalkaliphilus]